MRRFAVCVIVSLGVAVLALACDDGGGHGWHGGHHGHGGGRPHVTCHAQTTCGACTPIVGCGWCADGTGTGTCVGGPEDCDADAGASFNWDPSGCPDAGAGESLLDGGRIIADAQVGPPHEDGDASTDSGIPDAGPDAL